MANEKVEEKVTEKVADKKADAVKVVASKPVVAKPKYVKVIPKFTGKRKLGGTWYDFKQDKEIEVTEDAKRSLRGAGAIYL